MAVFIPPMPFDFHGSIGEREVFDALSRLDDTVYVFHSLRWVGRSPQSASQGEADFVIFDPQRGLLVIEVKSGNITCTPERRWFQQNRATGENREIEDPEIQASRSKFELLHALRGRFPERQRCLVCHSVWFPSGVISKTDLPMNYAPEFTLDCRALEAPWESISKAFEYWSEKLGPTTLKADGRQHVLRLIAPCLSVVPSLRYNYEVRERQFIRLTNEQSRIVEFLDEQKSAVIAGIAGTGKTVLAVEKARRLASQGGRVLVLCYNAALKNWLRTNNQIPNTRFENFHSLAASYVGAKGHDFDRLAEEFLECLANDEMPFDFDHVIIDEGQDFLDEWVEFLRLRTPGHFYLFFDPHQTVHTVHPPKWIDKAECRVVLRRNCRNTSQIHRTSCRCLSLAMERHLGEVDGPKPRLWEAHDDEDARRLVADILKSVFKKEIRPEETVILTLGSTTQSILKDVKRIGKWTIHTELDESSICFTTVRKFKGLEANVVLLIDMSPADLENEEYRRLLYLGSSRAKHELHIIMTGVSDDSIERAVKGLAGDRKVPRNQKGFAKLLDAQWMNRSDMEADNAAI